MAKTKKELRLEMKNRLNTVSEHDFTYSSTKIAETLFLTRIWKESRVIGLTVSRGREVETRTIIERAWKEGKGVAVPKCFPEDKSMEFYLITSYDQLEEVYFGLQEPITSETNAAHPHEIDLLIVPGVCYTEKGFRIGYGGGYYDRYLTSFTHQTISLLLECQLLPDIPTKTYDIPVQQLITERRMIACHE
jgi:5-formyltetrahydrofolate cyclo-ligase